jgi:hypothetical protein
VTRGAAVRGSIEWLGPDELTEDDDMDDVVDGAPTGRR